VNVFGGEREVFYIVKLAELQTLCCAQTVCHVFHVILTIYSDYCPVTAFPWLVFMLEIVLYGMGTECVDIM
jgi:hypothetical protein